MRTELLAETRDVVVLRLHGRPRDGETSQHRAVVVYVPATASPVRVAALLREAADALTKKSLAAAASELGFR